MFDLKVIGTKKVLYDKPAWSVCCDGTEAEFEFLSFHMNTVGALREGDLIIDARYKITIHAGAVAFYDNKCLILVEEAKDALFSSEFMKSK